MTVTRYKKLRTIASFPAPKTPFRNRPVFLLGSLNGNGFVYADPTEHQLHVLDVHGEPRYVIEKDSLKLDLATHLVFLGGDAAGKIYAVRVPAGESFFKDRKMFIDVFDDEGRYTHRITLDAFGVLKITKDAVFGLRFRDPHPPDIVKFKYKM